MNNRRLIETFSTEEAFKALNRSDAKKSKRIVESADADNDNYTKGLDLIANRIMTDIVKEHNKALGEVKTAEDFSELVKNSAAELFDEFFAGKVEDESAQLIALEDEFAKIANKLLKTNYKIEESKSRRVGKRVVESASIQVPAPYNRYFEVVSPAEIDFVDGMYEIGDTVAGVKILAYLVAKDAYADIFDDAFLVNDSSMPVVYIARDRVYPVDLSEVNESKSRRVGKRVVESAGSDIVELPGDSWGYPEFFADEVKEFGPDVSPDYNHPDVLQYYYKKNLPESDLLIKKLFVLNPRLYKDMDINTEEADRLLKDIMEDPSFVPAFGFQIANGDYLYIEENHNIPSAYVKCRDYNSMVKYLKGHKVLDHSNFGDAYDIIEESKSRRVGK